MRIRRKLTVLLAALSLTAGAAGAALAAGLAPDPEQVAVRCERIAQRLDEVEARAAEVAGSIAELEAMLESGELNPRQTARAQDRLARLE